MPKRRPSLTPTRILLDGPDAIGTRITLMKNRRRKLEQKMGDERSQYHGAILEISTLNEHNPLFKKRFTQLVDAKFNQYYGEILMAQMGMQINHASISSIYAQNDLPPIHMVDLHFQSLNRFHRAIMKRRRKIQNPQTIEKEVWADIRAARKKRFS